MTRPSSNRYTEDVLDLYDALVLKLAAQVRRRNRPEMNHLI